jgi:hypothetical protein
LTDKAIWLAFGVREHECPAPGEAAIRLTGIAVTRA